jgi:hypothetical protein
MLLDDVFGEQVRNPLQLSCIVLASLAWLREPWAIALAVLCLMSLFTAVVTTDHAASPP